MNFFFTRLVSTQTGEVFYYPYIDIILTNTKNNKGVVPLTGLIDSGADKCLVNSGYASTLLSVDYKSVPSQPTRGVTPNIIDVYYHDVFLEIDGFPNSKITVKLGFIESKSVSLLLGKKDFFENFKISFDLKNQTFGVDSYLDISPSRKPVS